MAIQKKHGKGRLDKWYKLAKEKGYRARAAFKLIQLNKKYGFLEKSRVLLDLCAAPGSWCQVAAEAMPVNSIIVGVDLSPIKPIPRVISFQGDITTEQTRATIRTHLKTWKADTVLHDGAPNVGTAWNQDSFNQAELALQAMKLATDFLVEGGTFVTKVFRSKDYNSLMWVFNQLFTKVEATKPPSSRNVSAEIFVVCRGYKAPKVVDPRFLDPRSVFEELAAPTPNNEAKVYKPELKKRKRDGYEEGDWTQFKVVSASEFVNTVDPIEILGSANKLSFDQPAGGDVALAALGKLPETTDDIRRLCSDLKVLGRKEFKQLLKWRLRARELFGLSVPKKATLKEVTEGEVAEVAPMDEELRIEQELQALKDKESNKRKKERRKENEKKQKEIVRMQLHMTAPMDIGAEQEGPRGEGSMFALRTVAKKDGALAHLSKGRMQVVKESNQPDHINMGDESEDSDPEEDRLERELDNMYESYKDRKADADTKYRAKRAREEHKDGEWEGCSAGEESENDSGLEEEDNSEDSDSEDDEKTPNTLLTDLDDESPNPDNSGLSKRARSFFNQDVFQGMDILDPTDMEMVDAPPPANKKEAKKAEKVKAEKGEAEKDKTGKDKAKAKKEGENKKAKEQLKAVKKEAAAAAEESDSSDDDGIEVVKKAEDWEEEKRRPDGRLDIDIITAEAMTLAHQLATGQKTKHDLLDEGFNKRAFRDRDGLPEWFMEDEIKHDKPIKPITKAAANAIKEKMRALNARPIKKVREAKARKKHKEALRLEKLRKKSDMLANDENLTESEKATTISKIMAKAAKKKPRAPLRIVVAKGANRGVKGRPTGVKKGRYRMVDPRMKKELRAMKRIAKKKK
ncbi:AdoMet-dependent rRNA methyltransferase SPB1 [Ceratocystis fimbriata CBS 114723]|uniref:AdoMet-dependent rRNA methyltransferase SPB1 n=1 Tax=Ceratocystis fimbriata CBS 114723 TaxID=1035309 RepID=A0A2C5X518_9PEZI|nr:AdoMet-dependent rRNA methyltransferase SPB1 [Ceratocystis fimbriata CBS 114723]